MLLIQPGPGVAGAEVYLLTSIVRSSLSHGQATMASWC